MADFVTVPCRSEYEPSPAPEPSVTVRLMGHVAERVFDDMLMMHPKQKGIWLSMAKKGSRKGGKKC